MSKKYPEHEKLSAVQSQSQSIGEFLDWMQNERKPHIVLAQWHSKRRNETLVSSHVNIRELLAEYFEIDMKKIEDEKDAMLEELRSANAPR